MATTQELLSKFRANSYQTDAPLSASSSAMSNRNPIAEEMGLEKKPNEVVNNVPFQSSPDDSGLEAGLKAAGNVPASTYNFGKNIVSAATSPIETGKGVFNIITGLGGQIQNQLSKLVEKTTGAQNFGRFENKEAQQTIDSLEQSLVERYGSLEAAQKTATEDPFGFGADVVGILTGTGVTRVPAITTAINKVEDINTAAKTRIANRVSGTVNDMAVGQMQKAINLNPSDIRRIKQPNIAGKDPAEWLLERNFKGSQESIANNLDEYRFTTKSQVDDGLAQLSNRVPASEANSAQNTLRVLKETFEGTVGNEPLLRSLDDMLAKNDYTLSELNDIKRLADQELNIFKSTGALKESATAKGLFNVRDELKTLIENKAAEQGFDAVKQLNKETQVAREISDAMKKRLDVSSKLPEFGLTDWIVAGGGVASGNVLPAAGIVISKQILQSPQFRTYLANSIKNLSPEQSTAVAEAVNSGNRMRVFEVLAPVINEYQNALGEDQTRNTETQEPEIPTTELI